ncbi:MAG: HlyC/CorC family transporter [Spirochaetes bacterium]|nr:MAG: HlyC/CorC family transporter [Spirochaetota bacterium]
MISQFVVYNMSIVAFMAFSFFFSGIETAIISSSPMKLMPLAEKGSRRAKRALLVMERVEDAISMALIGNNIVNIAASAFIAYIATSYYLSSESELLVITVAETIVFLVCCELFPKVLARAKAETFLMLLSPVVLVLMAAFKPAIRASLGLSRGIRSLMKLEDSSRFGLARSREEIDLLFRLGVRHGIIDKDHHDLINEFLSFHKVTAYEVMTPLIDLVSVEKRQTVRSLIDVIYRTSFSRIPVYEGRVDNIIGYVFYRDLLANTAVGSIEEIIHPPRFVPSTKNIHALYYEMRSEKIPVVFVVNEFGAVEGMATREDIAEEIVGEIQTRDHPRRELFKKVSERKFELSGNLDIDFLHRRFGLAVEKKGFETVAGFLAFHLGRIPARGDRFEFDNFVFVVDEATPRFTEKVTLLAPRVKK